MYREDKFEVGDIVKWTDKYFHNPNKQLEGPFIITKIENVDKHDTSMSAAWFVKI